MWGNKNMKTALVLEGGAKRGIYTAGVLDVLLENGLIADGVVGVSAGAIHGCSYASMQAGRSIRYNIKYASIQTITVTFYRNCLEKNLFRFMSIQKNRTNIFFNNIKFVGI